MGERAVDDSATTRDRRGRTMLAVVTSLVGIAYVAWRAGWTLTGVPAGLAISALVVEAVGVAGTVLLLGALRKPERVAQRIEPDVTIEMPVTRTGRFAALPIPLTASLDAATPLDPDDLDLDDLDDLDLGDGDDAGDDAEADADDDDDIEDGDDDDLTSVTSRVAIFGARPGSPVVVAAASVVTTAVAVTDPAGDGEAPVTTAIAAAIDVVVRFDAQPIGHLHATLAGVRFMYGVRSVTVVASVQYAAAAAALSTTRVEVVEADRYDSAALDIARDHGSAPLIAVFDAGDVPLPGFAGDVWHHFIDPSVAVVQTRLVAESVDSAEHDRRGRNELEFEREVLHPVIGAAGAGVFCGSGGVLRRSALDDVATGRRRSRRARRTAELHWSIIARSRGNQIVAPRQPVVIAAPIGSERAMLTDRRRRSAAALGVLVSAANPLWRAGLRLSDRAAYLAWMQRPLAGIRRAAFVAVLVVSFVVGATPIRPTWVGLAAIWLPWMVLQSLAMKRLSGATLTVGARARWSVRTMGPACAALCGAGRSVVGGAPRSSRRNGVGSALSNRMLVLAVVSVAVVAGLTAADRWVQILAELEPIERAGLLAMCLWVIAVALDAERALVAGPLLARHRDRGESLRAVVDGRAAQLANVSPLGAVVHFDEAAPCRLNDVVELVLDVPSGGALPVRVEARAVVRSVRHEGGGVECGVEFGGMSRPSADALYTYCVVLNRPNAAGADTSPRSAGAGPGAGLASGTGRKGRRRPVVAAVEVAATSRQRSGALRVLGLVAIAGVLVAAAPSITAAPPPERGLAGSIDVFIFVDHDGDGALDLAGPTSQAGGLSPTTQTTAPTAPLVSEVAAVEVAVGGLDVVAVCVASVDLVDRRPAAIDAASAARSSLRASVTAAVAEATVRRDDIDSRKSNGASRQSDSDRRRDAAIVDRLAASQLAEVAEERAWASSTPSSDTADAAVPGADTTLVDGDAPQSVVVVEAAPVTATDVGGGHYRFDALVGSPCRVEVRNLPAALTDAPLGIDNGGLIQIAAAGDAVRMAVTETETPGGQGAVRPVEIGDTVWLDTDGNGRRNPLEPGIAGVAVTLAIGDQRVTVQTDAGGRYRFTSDPQVEPGDGVASGITQLRQGTVATIIFPTTVASVATGDRSLYLQPPGAGAGAGVAAGGVIAVDLRAGFVRHDVDVAYSSTFGFTDIVFDDADNNGILGSEEPPIVGVRAALFAELNGDDWPDGPPIDTTVTVEGGRYDFTGLRPGRYVVEVYPPPGFMSSTGVNGSDQGPFEPAEAVASDLADISLPADAFAPQPGVVSDHGIQIPSGPVRSAAIEVGPAPATARQAPAVTGWPAASFGLTQMLSIADTVWIDDDLDGVLTAGEAGVAGVPVVLKRFDEAVTFTITDADGDFEFRRLIEGDYTVELFVPNGLEKARFVLGDDDGTEPAPGAIDATVDGATGSTVGVPLDTAPASTDAVTTTTATTTTTTTTTAATTTTIALPGGTVAAGAGTQAATQTENLAPVPDPAPPVAPVPPSTVESLAAGPPSTVAPGSSVAEPAPVPQPTVAPTLPATADLPVPAPGDQRIETVPVAVRTVAGAAGIDLIAIPAEPGAFGLQRSTAIGRRVWNDVDDDGIIDPDEPGIPGVAVKLIAAGEVVQRSLSALDGTFRFADPLPGAYTVEVALPAGTRTSSVSWADQKTAGNGIDNGGGQRVVGTAVTPPIVIGTSDSSDATAATIANVGVFAPLPAVEVEVYSNGCRADEPTASTGPIGECVTDSDDNPVVPVGSSVSINAVIRNSGNVALANAQVTATMSAGATTATPAPFESGSLDCNGFLDGDGQPMLLEVGDVVTCSAEMRVVAGQQSLTATLSATSERDPGVTDSFVSEPDVAAWFGGSGGLDLDAFVVTQRPGLDADGDGFIDPRPGTATVPGENPVFGVPEFTMTSVDDAPRAGGADFTANHVVADGDPLWWLYRLTNRGPGPLDSLSISVDGDVLCGGVVVPPGESAWCMTSERATVSGQLRRTATATANESTVATGIPIRVPPASAMAHAFVPSPGLTVTTFVDGIDAAQGPVPRDAGSSATLTYLIENVGDLPFGSVLLSDDSVGVIDCPELTAGLSGLQPGEVIGCSTVITVPVKPGDETLRIVVTAEATPIPLVPVPPPAADAADDAPAASPAAASLPAVVVEATTTIDPVTAAVLKRVWIDGDGDGVFDSSERPVAELNVALLDDDGEVATTTTDAAGRFAFADLEPDVYAIAYTIPSGLASARVLADRAVAIAGPVVSDPVRLGGVADNPAWDVALVETGPVGGVALAFDDPDGERNASEAVLTGATVLLRDSHGGTVDATLTDDSGSYRFENVPPMGRRAEVVPGSARAVSGVAAGAEPVTLTGRVWDDVDGDQRRPQTVGITADVAVGITAGLAEGVAPSDSDAGPDVDASAPADAPTDAPIDVTPSNATLAEGVAAGVIVSLIDGDGELLALTETDRSGTYRFPAVGAGTVRVLLGLYPSPSIGPSGDTANATVAVGPGKQRSVAELFVPPNRRFELVPDARSVADDPDPSGRPAWVPDNADEVLLGMVFIAAAVLAVVVLASARRRRRPV